MKINKILIMLCVLAMMATAVSATQFGVFYKDTSDARVKLYITFLDSDQNFMKLKGDLDTFTVSAQNLKMQVPGVKSDQNYDRLFLKLMPNVWKRDVTDPNGTSFSLDVQPYLYTYWRLEDGSVGQPQDQPYSLGYYQVTEEKKELLAYDKDLVGYGDSAYDLLFHSGVKVLNPKANSASERVAISNGAGYTLERETNSDLSQAMGSSFSTGVNAIYISTTKTDGIELAGNGTVLTQKVWIATLSPLVQASQSTIPKCADSIDNDADGLVDMNDPGCTSTTDNDEYNALPNVTATESPVTQEDMANEVGSDAAAAGAGEMANQSSPFFVMAKLIVAEKAVKKIRQTKAYMANKAAMEPLLKDIEKQLNILQEIAKKHVKTRVALIKKAAPARGGNILGRVFGR